MPSHQPDVTQLLTDWRAGDRAALEQLIPAVYTELRHVASRYLRRERANHTLQPTALVNEAFMKLVGQRDVQWQNRAHFFGVAAQLMRRILVDHARERGAAKRGGGLRQVTLDDALAAGTTTDVDVADLDRALTRLEALDADQSRIVELRFLGGLTIEETAAVLERSPATIKREWNVAKAWLYRELTVGQA